MGKIKYSNASYKGEIIVENGTAIEHGFGELRYKDGLTVIGYFKNGLLDGRACEYNFKAERPFVKVANYSKDTIASGPSISLDKKKGILQLTFYKDNKAVYRKFIGINSNKVYGEKVIEEGLYSQIFNNINASDFIDLYYFPFLPSKIKNYSINYLLKYYPKNSHDESDLSQYDLYSRDIIYRFKDGYINDDSSAFKFIVQAFSNFLRKKYKNDISNFYLVPIPASSEEVNRRRFAKFISKVCEITHMKDGFDLFKIDFSKEKSTQVGKSSNPIEHISVDSTSMGFLFNTIDKIVLIDDVITRGTSFVQCRQLLFKSLPQLTVVDGVFLGKTCYMSDFIKDADEEMFNSFLSLFPSYV